MTTDELPVSEREKLQNSLLRGERVVWLGRPQISSKGAGRMLAIAVFLLLFFGIATFFMYAKDCHGGVWLYGAIAMAGLIGSLAAPWLARRRNRCVLYVLTDRRALVMSGNRCRCYPRHADMLYHLIRHDGGSVSLALGQDEELGTNRKPEYAGFMYLPSDEWEEVYELMKKP